MTAVRVRCPTQGSQEEAALQDTSQEFGKRASVEGRIVEDLSLVRLDDGIDS